MRKLILSLALTAAFTSAWATVPVTATVKAVPDAPASAAAAPAGSVTVTGAKSVAGAPMTLTIDGKTQEPTFKALAEMARQAPNWTVSKLVRSPETTRVTMRGAQANVALAMDVSTQLGDQLKLKKGDTIVTESRQGPMGALVTFNKDKTPMGFMVSPGTQVTGH